MQVEFHRQHPRPLLRCRRRDGSSTALRVGATLPAHDLAHLVAENALALRDGFFGTVARGCDLDEAAQLMEHGPLRGHRLVAEVVARALQAVVTGACTSPAMASLVADELQALGQPQPETLSPNVVKDMVTSYAAHLSAWQKVPPEGCMIIEFTAT